MTGIGIVLVHGFWNPLRWKLGLREYQGEDWYYIGPAALIVERTA